MARRSVRDLVTRMKLPGQVSLRNQMTPEKAQNVIAALRLLEQQREPLDAVQRRDEIYTELVHGWRVRLTNLLCKWAYGDRAFSSGPRPVETPG